MKKFFHGFIFLVSAVLGLITLPNFCLADNSPAYVSPRFALYLGNTKRTGADKEYLVSADVIAESIAELDATYEDLSKLFKRQPSNQVVLRLLSPSDFRKKTGSPDWTSAMYFGGEITIPIPSKAKIDIVELRRAIRHEYVHAVIAELSGSRCPAWLDEGIAQIIEGSANPLVAPALKTWIETNDAMPLVWLESGFTSLRAEIVPAAYGQSLFMARYLVETLGFAPLRDYLRFLRLGADEDLAFELSFHVKKETFEARLTDYIRNWAEQEHASLD